MFVATLIAGPNGTGLDPALPKALRNAWGGGEVVWLSPDEAAEFTVPAKPDNQRQVWRDLQDNMVDLVVQPAADRRKKMLLADMDSTMIRQECIDELAEVAGVGADVKEITARAMNGEIDFEGALRERAALLAGLASDKVEEVLRSRITLMPGGEVLLATMKKNGAYAALVSGGFTSFTAVVAKRLGFDEHRANTLLFQDDRFTGKVAHPILGREAKVQALDEITKRLGLNAKDVIAVGDGANDLGMLQRAGTGVALHAKPKVAEQSNVRINHCDLTALLFLQGYGREEFIPA